MDSRSMLLIPLLLLGATFFCGDAIAQGVVKGVRCADLPIFVYTNRSGVTKAVTVQVVRNRCRPTTGFFRLRATPSSTQIVMADHRNHTGALTLSVSNLNSAELTFGAFQPNPVRGTFDYTVSVD